MTAWTDLFAFHVSTSQAGGCGCTGSQIGQIFFNIDDDEVLGITTEEQAAEFLKTEFPNMFPLIPHSEVKAFVQQPSSKVPTFQYAWPDLHYSNSVVLAGDAIHTVKPYFGLGVNSALDDVRWLHQCLTQHPVRNPDNTARCIGGICRAHLWSGKP